MSIFIEECIALNKVLPGAFSFGDLQNLYFDDYEKVLQKTKEMMKRK